VIRLVEASGVEPLSEIISTSASTGVDCVLANTWFLFRDLGIDFPPVNLRSQSFTLGIL